MLSLAEICQAYATDKNTLHCYVDEVYENLLAPIRLEAKRVLEIGVNKGASILMWKDYFPNAVITGIDSCSVRPIEGRDRINAVLGDAYSEDVLNQLSHDYDFIVDDGPHRLECFKFVAKHYTQRLKPGGILVMEDIQESSWLKEIQEAIPQGYQSYFVDLRKVRNRYDDLILVVNNS